MKWTSEQDAILKQMWAAGDTAEVAGAALGVTRSAALGRLHRLGLAHDPNARAKRTTRYPGRPSKYANNEERMEARRQRERERRADLRKHSAHYSAERNVPPPDEVEAERRRAYAPEGWTLTMMLMGDPPRGRSALERERA